MNTYHILDALGELDERSIEDARKPRRRPLRLTRLLIAAAAALLALALCGFTAYELGLFDPWLQTPGTQPEQVVRTALENQLKKDYTLTVRVDGVHIDPEETARTVSMYQGSDLAQARGWTDQYLAEHFVAVRAEYYVEYDHTRTFLDDGDAVQYFYLTEDPETGLWEISDNTH